VDQAKAANRLPNRLLNLLDRPGVLALDQEDFLYFALALAMTEGLPDEHFGGYAVAAMNLWYAWHFPCDPTQSPSDKRREARRAAEHRRELRESCSRRLAVLDHRARERRRCAQRLRRGARARQPRPARCARRTGAGSESAADPPAGESEGEPPGEPSGGELTHHPTVGNQLGAGVGTPRTVATFDHLHIATSGVTGPERAKLFDALPVRVQRAMWARLAHEVKGMRA
jgi:hypothetical protein